MGDRRIPVSLKVPEDDFYTDFIVPKRDSKELSQFIYQMLRAYYENDDVKEVLKPFLITASDNRIAFLNEQLAKIANFHSETLMETEVLRDEIDRSQADLLNKIDNLGNDNDSMFDDEIVDAHRKAEEEKRLLLMGTQNENKVSKEEKGSVDLDRVDRLENSVASLKASVENLTSQLAQFLSKQEGKNIAEQGTIEVSVGVSNVQSTETSQGVLDEQIGVNEPKTGSVISQSEVTEQVSSPQAGVPEQAGIIEQAPQISVQSDSEEELDSLKISAVNTSNDEVNLATAPVQEEENKQNEGVVEKPAAFASLLKSMKTN